MRIPCPGRLILALAFVIAAWHPGAMATPQRVETFDLRVSAGLPQAFSVPAGQGHPGLQVLVTQRLNSELVLPDGSQIREYVKRVARIP